MLFTTLPRSAQHVSALGLSSKKANAVHETTNFVLSFTAANTADFRLVPRAEGVGTDAAASPAFARVLVRVARDMGVDKIATRVLSKSGSSTRRVRSTFVFEREVTARAGSLLSVEESLAIVVGDGRDRAAIMQPTDARWCDDGVRRLYPPFRETVDGFLVSSFYYTIKGWMNMRCIVNGCSRGAIVVSIERLGWDALEKFSREDAQERPGEIEGVVNVASLVALVDKLALKLV